jgi:hypothetical protein
MKTMRSSVVVRALALGLLLAVVGCAGADDGRPPSVSNTDTDTDTDTEPTKPTTKPTRRACDSGSVQECTIYLKAQGSVQNCYPGLSVCSDGQWTDCLSVEDAEGMLESLDEGSQG